MLILTQMDSLHHLLLLASASKRSIALGMIILHCVHYQCAVDDCGIIGAQCCLIIGSVFYGQLCYWVESGDCC